MKLVDLFPVERVFLDVDVSNRKELLGFLSARAAELGLVNQQLCARALGEREELGSTGLGSGIAIPHARIRGLDRSLGILAVLSNPIEFEAADQEPVDIVLMLLMPEHAGAEQMQVLSRIAKVARQARMMNGLRQAAAPQDATEIFRRADAES